MEHAPQIDFSTAASVSNTFHKVLDCSGTRKYTVSLEFSFEAERDTGVSNGEWFEPEVFTWLVRDTTDLAYATSVRDAFLKATPEDVLLFCLYTDVICITEVFNIDREASEEGDTNWFKRHGFPEDVKIMAIGPIDVTIRSTVF